MVGILFCNLAGGPAVLASWPAALIIIMSNALALP